LEELNKPVVINSRLTVPGDSVVSSLGRSVKGVVLAVWDRFGGRAVLKEMRVEEDILVWLEGIIRQNQVHQ
jgi:hypothetical protein